LEFIRKTGVGRMSGMSRPEADQDESHEREVER
jgi:hypothetical protein